MNIIRNIPMAIEFVVALHQLNRQKKSIDKYRALEDLEHEREHILKATSDWGKRLAKDLNIELNVMGKENIPEKGPVVFVPNHQGYGDIPICCAILDKFQTGFIAKSSLTKIPLYGEWVENIRSVIIDREDPRASLRSIEKGIEFIEQGFSMVVFPEGHRSRGGEMSDFKKGSLKLATKPGVPIIPISLDGTYKLFEAQGYMKGNFRVDFLIHPPIETVGLSRHEAIAMPEVVEQIVRKGLADIRFGKLK